MSDALDELVATLRLDPVAEGRLRGRPRPTGEWDSVYGGHFLGQATAAALATVPSERRIHSLHAYFLKAGVAGEPIDYDVSVVREGRSFCTRRVTANQGRGANVELIASFAVEQSGPTIVGQTPDGFARLPEPEALPTFPELMASRDPVPFPPYWAFGQRGMDVRVVNAPWCDAGPSPRGGIRTWNRADGVLPDDPALHAALFAYHSDDSISDNLVVPFDVTWATEGAVVLSLDHALWFHRPFRMDEWLLIEQWPVVADGARGLAQGQVFDRDGVLVASFTQEALVRI